MSKYKVTCPYPHLYDKYKNNENVYLKPDDKAFELLVKYHFGDNKEK